MAVKLHLLKESGRLKVFEGKIQHALTEILTKVEQKLLLPDIDIVIADNPDATIPETGVSGFAPSAHLLYVSIDPDHSELSEKIECEVKSTVAHELHHCTRWSSVGYGETLLEACISEGLADHFDLEVNGGDPKPWSVALKTAELEEVMKRAVEVFDREYDKNEWFWGMGTLPRWTGYSLGFSIVRAYIQQTGRLASDIVAMPAKEFLK